MNVKKPYYPANVCARLCASAVQFLSPIPRQARAINTQLRTRNHLFSTANAFDFAAKLAARDQSLL